MDYKNNSNTGLIIVADCMLLSVECIGNVHLFFNKKNRVCCEYYNQYVFYRKNGNVVHSESQN